MAVNLYHQMQQELISLEKTGSLRKIPDVAHEGKYIVANGNRMLNLSSNDYLGLAGDKPLKKEFLTRYDIEKALFSASSSRLLTGNNQFYEEVETTLSQLFRSQAALVFNSGYHANTGILPAIANDKTLILADKLIHASLIDGIRLSSAKFNRYKHNDLAQLENLIAKNHTQYEKIIVVTESIFSMDGDVTDLTRLVELKKMYPSVMLYVDEAHAIGVRGNKGLGIAEEQNCIQDIDFLVGTFGKALNSVGAYVICNTITREYLINKMRTLIFTTALPAINLMWTHFILQKLDIFNTKRAKLCNISKLLKEALANQGYLSNSASHIIPMVVGETHQTMLKSQELREKGFYVLPIRPPTVPHGTSRLRFSLTAGITDLDIRELINSL